MQVIDRSSTLWQYIKPEIRELLEDGEIILSFVFKYHAKEEISDYSFLVFPFAKAYEGFLKGFFLDLGLIRHEEYFSDEIRIGRILNPHYTHERENVFNRVCGEGKKGNEISHKLWNIWKRGRNLVFHYFPHNYRRLSYNEALDIVNEIVSAMNAAVMSCRVTPFKKK